MNSSTYIIEQLVAYNRFFNERLKQGHTEYKQDKLSANNIANMLHQGAKFLLPINGDVGVTITDDKMMDLVKCPYPVVFFEYEMDKSLELDPDGLLASTGANMPIEPCSKRAVSIMDTRQLSQESGIDMGIPGLMVVTFHYSDREKKWMLTPLVMFFPEGEHIAEIQTHPVTGKPTAVYLGKSINAFPGTVADAVAQYPNETEDRVMQRLSQDMAEEIGNAFAALACLNAKNVGTVTVPAPQALNKKRRKNGKIPFFEYKVLDIFLGDGVRKLSSGSGKRFQAAVESAMRHSNLMRLHAVRGHFKVRKTGIFWWRNFVRGSSKNGAIEKDYNLTPS